MNIIIEEIKADCEKRGKYFHSWNEKGDHIDEEDGWTVYTEIETSLAPEDVQHIIYSLREEGYGRMSCGHMHDCCGCSFLSSWRVFSTFPHHSAASDAEGQITRSIIIKESWGVNV